MHKNMYKERGDFVGDDGLRATRRSFAEFTLERSEGLRMTEKGRIEVQVYSGP
jgi:hypothetical protein